jgi:hypothetical protein
MNKISKLNKNQVLTILDDVGEISEDELDYSNESINTESEDEETSEEEYDEAPSIYDDVSHHLSSESPNINAKQSLTNIKQKLSTKSFYKNTPKHVVKNNYVVSLANKVKKKAKVTQVRATTQSTSKVLDSNKFIAKNGNCY